MRDDENSKEELHRAVSLLAALGLRQKVAVSSKDQDFQRFMRRALVPVQFTPRADGEWA